MEVASSIKLALKDAVNIRVITLDSVPLQHVFGKEVGSVFLNLAAKNGVQIITNANVKEIKSNNKNPQSVVLENEEVPSDVLIMATGVRCAVDFAKDLVDK